MQQRRIMTGTVMETTIGTIVPPMVPPIGFCYHHPVRLLISAVLTLVTGLWPGDGTFQSIGKGKAMVGDVETVAVSASGRYAATNCNGVFQLVDTSGGFFDEWEFESRITGICFSGEKAYLFKENGTVEIRDCKGAKFLNREKVPTPASYPMVGGGGAKMYYVGPEPKGDAESGLACIDSHSGKVDFYLPNCGTAGLFDVTTDGKKVVAAERKQEEGKSETVFKLKLYDVDTKSSKTLKETKLVEDVGDFITSCHFSPDGKTILACVNSGDKEGRGNCDLVTFDVATGKAVTTAAFPEALIGEVAYLPDGKTVIFQNGKDLVCYDLAGSKALFSIDVGRASTTPLKVSADGTVVALPDGKQMAMWKIAR